MGRSGLSVARALRESGAEVACWDDMEEARSGADGEGFRVVDLNGEEEIERLACLVVSPGVPHLYPEIHPVIRKAYACGVPVDNDVGLFFRSFGNRSWEKFDVAPRVVAVTGSNGKSTTSALVHHCIGESGGASQLAGNIGFGALGMDPPGDGEVVVLELSSYQIELARSLTPDIAVFLNLSADHLDRHGGLGGYFAAKRRLFSEGCPDRAVIGVDQDEGAFLANACSEGGNDAGVIRISSKGKIPGPGWSVFAFKGFLSEMRAGRQAGSIDLRRLPALPGLHNQQNACAAYAACRSLGLSPSALGKAFETFQGLPHRSQRIGEKNGVVFVNDSKATNAGSAAMSLGAFDRIRWIAGGLGKEGGISGLRPCVGNVIKAYFIGRSGKDFAAEMPDIPSEICETMEVAVSRAAGEAESGDTVLLAPAAASFDQYSDFEARGDHFVECVNMRMGA